MKKAIRSFLLLVVLLSVSACEVEENPPKPLGTFNTITANGLITFNLVGGPENKVISTTLLDQQYNVSYGNLSINGVGNITIAVKNLYLLSCNGCEVKNTAPFTADTLNFSMHGGSMDLRDISITRYLGITAINTGKYRLAGQAALLNLNLTNLVDYGGYNLVTDSTYVTSTNHIECKVHATQVINAIINGNGDVNYKGNPPIKRASYTSAGRLVPK